MEPYCHQLPDQFQVHQKSTQFGLNALRPALAGQLESVDNTICLSCITGIFRSAAGGSYTKTPKDVQSLSGDPDESAARGSWLQYATPGFWHQLAALLSCLSSAVFFVLAPRPATCSPSCALDSLPCSKVSLSPSRSPGCPFRSILDRMVQTCSLEM